MSKMNFLDKARKKVEDAIIEVQATATQLAQGRVYPGMYTPMQGEYPYQQPGQYPLAAHHGQYPAQTTSPPQQWHQPQQQHYGPPHPGQPQAYHSPPSVQSQPYHTPSPIPSPASQPSYVASPPQQYYASSQGLQGQSYTPSPMSSPVPLHSATASSNQPQYFSPIPGQPGQRYTPSPNQQQQYYVPPPSQPHQPYSEPPPAYTPPLNDLLGGPRPTPPNLPPRRESRASNASQSNVPLATGQQSNLSDPNLQQPSVSPPSQPNVPYPVAFELPAPEPQELAATEVRRPSNPPGSDPAMPKPLALPSRQRQSVSVVPPVVTAPALKIKLPCLAAEGVRTASTKFYIPKTQEDFSACENCYHMYLAPHPGLVVCFEPYKGPETVFVCDMSFGRVQQIVLTQCVPHSTLDPIRDFVKIFSTLTPCTGAIISSPGPMWITRSAVIPHLAICTTCFELYFRLTPFASHFETAIHSEPRDWSCDIAVPYFKRLLRCELSKSPINFASFAEEANSRFTLPPCAGPGKPIEKWVEHNKYLLFSAKGGLGRVCLSCYSDLIEVTPREDDWQMVELVGDDIGKASCDLAGPYSKLAMKVAIKRGDTAIWRTVVGLDGKLPHCHSLKGIDEAETTKEIQEIGDIAQWYQITDSPTVLACSRCYWLAIQLFGADIMCSPITSTLVPGDIRQCSWTHSNTPDETSMESADNFENSLVWRGRRLRTALAHGYDSGDWTQIQTVAASIAKEPPACAGRDRGLKRGSGRKWYGRLRSDKANEDDCTIVMCEECFVRSVKSRPYEALFNTDLTDAAYRDEGTGGFICQPYTNRARGFLRAAADSGQLAPFARYWNNREALALRRNQWLPILQQQNLKMAMYNQQTSLQMMLKGNAMANALAKKGSAGIVEAVSGETGYRYGNSQIGMNFLTQGSADAEQDWQNASNMKVGQGMGNPLAETMRIQALWEVDNQAFLAVE